MRKIGKLKQLLYHFLIFSFVFSSAAFAKPEGKLVIFHAGSLSIPFREMANAFQKKYPEVKVYREAAGSRTCARKIMDLGRPCDVMASADYTVIENLLFPDYASWNISFATNEMAIMYLKDSKYSSEINGDNWYKILLKNDVDYGRSDPNSDPCGYRTILVWKLAERFYDIPGLFKLLLNGCPPKNLRPKETDLIAMLEAGQIDYLFIYRSVCEQHKMPYVKLPPQVNLGSPEYENFYSQAEVRITGKKPGTWIIKRGAPMIYGITIPRNAPNKEAAIAFVDFVLGPEGRRIIQRNGQRPLDPPQATGKVRSIPLELKRYIR